MAEFELFYSNLKFIEENDSALTSPQQIDRLLRPGCSYLNLNPFEVLQLDPDTFDLAEARKKYKKLSLLLHPDKNPDDKERSQRAFEYLKKAMCALEDPDEVSRCKDVYAEAKARLAIIVNEKKRKLRREGKNDRIDEDMPQGFAKALWITVTKVKNLTIETKFKILGICRS